MKLNIEYWIMDIVIGVGILGSGIMEEQRIKVDVVGAEKVKAMMKAFDVQHKALYEIAHNEKLNLSIRCLANKAILDTQKLMDTL